jgi:hypothetical protein
MPTLIKPKFIQVIALIHAIITSNYIKQECISSNFLIFISIAALE